MSEQEREAAFEACLNAKLNAKLDGAEIDSTSFYAGYRAAEARNTESFDAVAACAKVMQLVDEFAERQTADNRHALRGALMDLVSTRGQSLTTPTIQAAASEFADDDPRCVDGRPACTDCLMRGKCAGTPAPAQQNKASAAAPAQAAKPKSVAESTEILERVWLLGWRSCRDSDADADSDTAWGLAQWEVKKTAASLILGVAAAPSPANPEWCAGCTPENCMGCAAPAQAQQAIQWPKARDVGRLHDMSPAGHLRVGLDNDNDVYVEVFNDQQESSASVEFCNGGGGGGRSMRTRMALIALMVAMEADNAERPDLDWWARRGGSTRDDGGAKAGG